MEATKVSGKFAIKNLETMDVEEYLDFLNGDDKMEECPYCGRFLSVSHQSVCDKG